VTFVEKNVRQDKEALKDLLERGFQSTPVTLIGDEAVVGFDQARIDALLG
jgi:hypothetical protein